LIRSDVLGVQSAIVLASVLNGVVGFLLVLSARPAGAPFLARRAAVPAAALIAIPIIAIIAGRWDPKVINSAPFHRRAATNFEWAPSFDYFAEGVDMTVAVYHYEKDPQHLVLTVNGKPDASTGIEDMTTQRLLAYLPALLAPSGKKACIIGLGSG
jgi:hypothetical protein